MVRTLFAIGVVCIGCDIPPLLVDEGTGGASNGSSSVASTTGSGGQGGSPLSYAEMVIADGAIAYWRLGEAPGATMAVDETGNLDGYFAEAPVLGEPGLIAGDDNTSAHFMNCAHQVRMADALSFENNQPFSLEVWVKPDTIDDSGRTLMGKETTIDPLGIQGYRLWQSASGVGLARFRDNVAEGVEGAPLALFTTSHVVATYDGQEVCVYVDAGDPTCGRSTQSIQFTTSSEFGLALEGSCYQGVMDEAAVYAVPLDHATIQAHRDAGAAR